MKFALSHVKEKRDGTKEFANMMDEIHIDEKWFYGQKCFVGHLSRQKWTYIIGWREYEIILQTPILIRVQSAPETCHWHIQDVHLCHINSTVGGKI